MRYANERDMRNKNLPTCDCHCTCGAVNGYPARPGGTRCRRCSQTCPILETETREEVSTVGVETREPLAIPAVSPRALQCSGCEVPGDDVAEIYGVPWHSRCYREASYTEKE